MLVRHRSRLQRAADAAAIDQPHVRLGHPPHRIGCEAAQPALGHAAAAHGAQLARPIAQADAVAIVGALAGEVCREVAHSRV